LAKIPILVVNVRTAFLGFHQRWEVSVHHVMQVIHHMKEGHVLHALLGIHPMQEGYVQYAQWDSVVHQELHHVNRVLQVKLQFPVGNVKTYVQMVTCIPNLLFVVWYVQ